MSKKENSLSRVKKHQNLRIWRQARKWVFSQAAQRETPLRSPSYFVFLSLGVHLFNLPFLFVQSVVACACIGEAKPSHLYIYKHTPQCHFIENS